LQVTIGRENVADNIEGEIDAIRAVLKALEALSPEARVNVLDYVQKSLKIGPPVVPRTAVSAVIAETPPSGDGEPVPSAIHIKQLKEQKSPRSANEMAALVAYYLANNAPADQRKTTITAKDIETYFKIADFPLPKEIRFTLPNAKAAGYFDAAGSGAYKLNAVGHNLVVHSMPRTGDAGAKGRRRGARRKKPTKGKRRASAKRG
jgi:hypothetical protein